MKAFCGGTTGRMASSAKRRHAVMFIAFGIGTTSSGGIANEYRDNPSIVVDRSVETQFMPIGELVSDRVAVEKGVLGNLQGTAFLVSPCYILTAAHVVFGSEHLPKPGIDYTMHFSVGVGPQNGFSGSVKAAPDLSVASITAKSDWVFLKLDSSKCLGAHPRIGYFEISEKELVIGEKLVAVGYGYAEGRKRGTLAMGQGEVMSKDADGFYQFSGSYIEGASGGPLFESENGIAIVAGLITSQQDFAGTQRYDKFSERTANNIQSASDIISDPAVKSMLDADKARFGNVNPAAESRRRPLPNLETVPH